jgi:E3 ubiquitin-protein ligase SIAH1
MSGTQTPQSPADTATNSMVEPDFINTVILKNLLECPVCLTIPRKAPIFQCTRGHIVCGECKPNLRTCPQCQIPMDNIRSLVSEKVLEQLPTSCKYADHGCQVEMMRDVLVEHEKHCQNRTVNCVVLDCKQKVTLSSLLSHLCTDHVTDDLFRVEGGEYNTHFVVYDKYFTVDTIWISVQLHFDSKYFFLECCRSKEGLWNIWVYMLETKQDESENYLCEISINSAKSKDQLLFRGRPFSLDLTRENIVETRRGLVFTDATARLFRQDDSIPYRVSIQKQSST